MLRRVDMGVSHQCPLRIKQPTHGTVYCYPRSLGLLNGTVRNVVLKLAAHLLRDKSYRYPVYGLYLVSVPCCIFQTGSTKEIIIVSGEVWMSLCSGSA